MKNLFLMLLLSSCVAGCDGYFAPLDLSLDAGATDSGGGGDATQDLGGQSDSGVGDVGPEDGGADAADTSQDTGPGTELCGDGVDNDGDGDTDEGFHDVGEPCDSEVDSDACLDGVIECADDGLSTLCNDGSDNVPPAAFCGANPMFPTTCINPESAEHGFLLMLGEACDSTGPNGDADRCDRGVWVCNAIADELICDEQGTFTPEICDDEIDNDCDMETDEISPEVCDLIDNDCDGELNEGFDPPYQEICQITSNDCQGIAVCDGPAGTTCVLPMTTPTEICDGLDNDCNGQIDEGCDDDSDGSCDMNMAYSSTFGPQCFPGDCDDSQPTVYPGSTEVCDRLDNNCDGAVDEGQSIEDGVYDQNSNNNDTAATAFFVSGDPFLPGGGMELTPASSNTRLVVGDADWFEFRHTFSSAPATLHFLCRITDIHDGTPGQQTVDLQIDYLKDGVAQTSQSAILGNNGVFGVADTSPANVEYIWRVGISAETGFDNCDNLYKITCKARDTGGVSMW